MFRKKNVKMVSYILSGLLVMSNVCLPTLSVYANESEITQESILEENQRTDMEYIKIAESEMDATNIPEEKTNVLERTYEGEVMYVNPINTCDIAENTDPNYAYAVNHDTVYQGSILNVNEMRWYAFGLNEKSKITILLQMVETLDADLYMFQLDETSYQLSLIGGSAVSGTGNSEYVSTVLDAGIYYFAVSGYEGTGDYAFAYFQSSTDALNEVNDTYDTATSVSINSSTTGIIDSTFDVDYYKLTVSNPMIMKYSISSSTGYSLLFAKKEGSNAAIYSVDASTNTVKVNAGTYYFVVYSQDKNYSTTSAYTVKFSKVFDVVDSSIEIIGICDKANINFQSDSLGKNCYVNGNKININYSYKSSSSNSAGSQSYNISINHRDDVYASIRDDASGPAAVHYVSSTRPAMNVGSRAVLMLTYNSADDFYAIHCRGTGSYSMNTLWTEMDAVIVLVDPSTGKLVDIVSYNYFYDFAPVGTNSITFTNPYSMTLYKF
ncbi:MAG: hypothetical protein IJN64_08900 [Lachnospiraceae bacterium]|nr:hypothetical protein [Lachnospiraceae bacterium]